MLLIVLGLVALPGTAAAHTSLRSSDPEDGATVTTAPSTVTLTFDGPISTAELEVVVTGPDGAQYQADPPAAEGSVVRAGLAPLGPPGPYVVAYRVVGADGHAVTGEIAFELAQPAPAPAPPASSEPAAAAPPPASPPSSAPSEPVAPSSAPSSTAAATTPDAGNSAASPPASGAGPSPTSASVQPAAASTASSGISNWVWVVIAVAAAAVGATLLIRRRRAGRG